MSNRERVNSAASREDWLLRLVDAMRPAFGEKGSPIPASVRVSCGWTGQGMRTKRIGECWAGEGISDGIAQIYVSPVIADSQLAAETVVHELVHAAVGAGHSHGKVFRKLAVGLGLAGPMRGTHAGPQLADTLAALIAGELGAYPHTALTGTSGRRVQTTRMLKLTCPACGYTCRTTQKWVEVGMPTCPCGEEMELPA